MDNRTDIYPQRRTDDRSGRRLRKGMYILPSIFTCANVLLGYYAILQVIHGAIQFAVANATQTPVQQAWHFDNAAKAIGFAVLFDGLDGRIARMTGTTSDFGRELDSLADVITFGIAPALLAFAWGVQFSDPDLGEASRGQLFNAGTLVAFLFLLCGACRLARQGRRSSHQPPPGYHATSPTTQTAPNPTRVGQRQRPACKRYRQHLTAVDPAEGPPRLAPEEDVLRHRQVRRQQRLLMDHGDPDRGRIGGSFQPHLATLPEHPAGVALVHPGDDLHQRGLAGAILTQKKMRFAGLDRQVSVRQCLHSAESLLDSL